MRNRLRVAVVALAIFWLQAATVAAQMTLADDRMYLPADMSEGLTLGMGLDSKDVNTSKAKRESPFTPKVLKQRTTSEGVRRGGFEFESVSSLREETTKSSFAARANIKSPLFATALSINRDRETGLSETSLRLYAFTRVELERESVDYLSLPEDAFSEKVRQLRKNYDAAVAKADYAAALRIRQDFRNIYGTGFVKTVVKGGMFVLRSTRGFSTKTERDAAQQAFEVGSGPASASAQSSDAQAKKLQTELFSTKGKFVGGKYFVAEPTWAQFQTTAPTWAKSVEDDKNTRDILSTEYVGYYMVDYLQPLAARPAALESALSSVRGYFGAADTPNTGAIMTYERNGSQKYGSIPLLIPVGAVIKGSHVRILVTVDPDLARDGQRDRIERWKHLKFQEVATNAQVASSVDDPLYVEDMIVWPSLVTDAGEVFVPVGSTSELPIKQLVDDAIAARNNSRALTQMSGWFDFELGPRTRDAWGAIESGKVQLTTNWTIDHVDVRDTLPVTLAKDTESSRTKDTQKRGIGAKVIGWFSTSDDTPNESRMRFVSSNAMSVWASNESMKRSIENSIDAKVRAAVDGPPKRVVNIPTGAVLFTRSCWADCKTKATEQDFKCAAPEVPITVPPSPGLVSSDPILNRDAYAKDGMVLVGKETLERVSGPNRGCAVQDGRCFRSGEQCMNWQSAVTRCYVSSDWKAWAERTMKRLNLPLTDDFICSPPT